MTLADGKIDDSLIKDGTVSTFMVDVVEASKAVPVLVDFWADWCQPCKTLTPLLEKAVLAANGAVKLVKINADENQELGTQLRIKSLPTVLAFKDGEAVDGFSGALPESEINKFIAKLGGDSHAPNVDDFLAKAGKLLERGEVEPALELYGQISQADPSNLEAIGGLARCLIKLGKIEKASGVLKMVPAESQGDRALAGAFAALDLARKEPEEGVLIELKKKVEANPSDNQAAYDLAENLFAAGQRDQAASTLLDIIRREREWNDEAARKLLLKMFQAAGLADPFTVENRKHLSSILFS